MTRTESDAHATHGTTTRWLAALTAAAIAAYWSSVALGVIRVDELVPGYRHWFFAFPVADAWIGLWAALTAWTHRRAPARARRYALLAGSGLVFLALNAASYGVVTRLVCRATAEEYLEIAIKLGCLTAGAWFVRHGLGDAAEGGAPGSAPA
jgi:hypothetical protein